MLGREPAEDRVTPEESGAERKPFEEGDSKDGGSGGWIVGLARRAGIWERVLSGGSFTTLVDTVVFPSTEMASFEVSTSLGSFGSLDSAALDLTSGLPAKIGAD
jgi:hypothetical protein